jgi:hypothetical protein
VTGDYLPEFDRGRETAAAFADLDDDDDFDLFLGSGTEQEISLYENIGTEADPLFALIQESWLPLPNSAWAAPEFADIDADLDLDLFVGMTSGAVRFWRNDAPGSWPPVFTEILDDADFGDAFGRTIRDNVDAQAVPRFFDEDGDEDLDVLLGNWDFGGEASLIFFRNDGTSFVVASTDYQGLGSFGQNLAPTLQDLDRDEDVDLLVGNRAGNVVFARNVGAPGAPLFQPEAEFFASIDVGRSSVPALVDIDADLDPDLVLGERGGGLNFYRNTSPSPVGVVAQDSGGEPARLQAWPNPFRDRTLLTYELLRPGRIELGIYDVHGRLVRALESARRSAVRHSLWWDGRDQHRRAVAPGVYFARVETEHGVDTQKVVLTRE